MNKTYAFTDLHGQYDLWEQIKNYCDDTDTLYFLGDACDRGPDGLKIIRELLKDKRVIYIMGNHEEHIEQIGSEVIEGIYSNVSLWFINGGKKTFKDFDSLEEFSQIWYIKKIMRLPATAKYINKKGQEILLSHAGYTPTFEPQENKKYEYWWDREHIYDAWPPGYENTFIIHGHTPVDIIRKDLQILRQKFKQDTLISPITYCDDHKICLDVASFDSKSIVLFDLDELKVERIFGQK